MVEKAKPMKDKETLSSGFGTAGIVSDSDTSNIRLFLTKEF